VRAKESSRGDEQKKEERDRASELKRESRIKVAVRQTAF
jgi:hypothetical protein